MLYTDRLVLREWTEEDIAPFAAINADPRVREFFSKLLSPDESRAEVRQFQDGLARDGFGLFASELRSDGTFIGFVGIQTMTFSIPQLPEPAVEIGWRLGSDWWGQGYATEAARAVSDYAFGVIELPRLVSITVPANLRSRHVMEKVGMLRRPELDFSHPRIAEGHPLRSHVLYELTRQRHRELSRR